MTKSTITREQVIALIAEHSYDSALVDALEHLLATMNSEPVALQPELAKVIYHFRDWNEGFPVERFKADYVISWMLANYPPAQPAPERDQVRSAHAEWSQATFGNVGPVGPLKHLSKEALEAAAEPGDLSEWADMQFLLWDAQRRAGVTDEQITQAMIEKLAVNKQRSWPEPKDGEPRLHIKEQPAPVVPDGVVTAEHRRVIEMLLNVCGAAFELADDSCQQDVDGEDCHVVPDDAFQKLSDALDEIENTLPTEDIDRPDVFLAWSAMPRAALKSILQAGNSPEQRGNSLVIPDEMTPEQAYEIGDYHGDPVDVFARGANWMRQHIIDSTLAAAPQLPGSDPATVPGKWIPVSERIPDNTEPVLCIEKRADFGTYGQPFVCWHDGGGWVGKTNYRPIVTHWMPLPAAPAGGEVMENRYIYHYCAVNGNASISGIAQLTFRIKSQEDVERLKELIAGDDFRPKAINSLSYLGRENDD
ncbi:Eaa1 [Klebsiella pneumoniae]|uniref:Eaa1 n=2 Tax=Klebsiella/Raoultella group TaxID=2890311 RepID=A0A377TQ74_KLEPN|nr:Eaa1 [Klebsiella pneumoniae]